MGSPVAAGEAEYTWRGMDRASFISRDGVYAARAQGCA